MVHKFRSRGIVVVVLAACLLGVSQAPAATLVNSLGSASAIANANGASADIEDYLTVYRFDVPLFASFDVAMFDARTPVSVANFGAIAGRGDYDGTFFHRSVAVAGSGIGIIQGGGYSYTNAAGVAEVPEVDPIVNEPGLLNTTGTIAMAKTAAGPDSATTQWYINTIDNPALDDPANNSGYTVFGEVLYDGMDVCGLDNGTGGIANLQTYNLDGPFTNLPLRDAYTGGGVYEDDVVNLTSVTEVTGQTFAVVGNSDPSLISASFAGSTLSWQAVGAAGGSADLTVRVTDGADAFDAVLTINVLGASGDFDGDGDTDVDDINALIAELAGGAPSAGDLSCDIDGDGDVDQDDLVYLIENLAELQDGSTGAVMGDVNLDGLVNETDVAALDAAYGSAGGWDNGNFGFDGIVNATDLAVMAANYGIGDGGAAETPEPASIGLMVLAGAALLRRRRR
ncbi:MAG: peptidylprolyl isomerase [Planctomycetota bacterium]